MEITISNEDWKKIIDPGLPLLIPGSIQAIKDLNPVYERMYYLLIFLLGNCK